MSLFSPKSTNATQSNKLLGYKVQTSIYGSVVPIVLGTNKVGPNVIWTGDWVAAPVQAAGGKGSGKASSGGKGGGGTNQQYTYSTAIQMALCIGPIVGIGRAWKDKVELVVATSVEATTIAGTYNPINKAAYYQDLGAARVDTYSVTANDYGSPGSVTLSGTQPTPLVQVDGTPAAGQYSVASDGTYTFSGADAGKQVIISYSWLVPGQNSTDPITALGLTLYTGTQGQPPWPHLQSAHPDQALTYSGVAHLDSATMDLGSSGLVSNFNFEVYGQLIFGGGVLDAEPTDCARFLIADEQHGVMPGFPLGDMTQARNYCVANGLFCSPLLDQQQPASQWLADLATIGNFEYVWSDNMLKIRSRGDVTVVGNGVTFTPDTNPIYELNDDDLMCASGEDPINVAIKAAADIENDVTVEWSNRTNAYLAEPLEEKDDWAIGQNPYGVRAASVLSLHEVCTQPVAQKVAATLLNRSVYLDKTITFKLPPRYCLLEPMDLVTLDDPYLGYSNTPVRVITVEEGDDDSLDITAENFPWGTAGPTINPKQGAAPYMPGYFADPHNVNSPIFYEPPPELTQDTGYELLIALSGSQDWGGCIVWESTDDATYRQIGVQNGPSVMGTLTAQLPTHADPDNSSTLSVDLTGSDGALQSWTSDQKDNLTGALLLVGHEIISYETATLTSANHYNVTGLRRGVFGTAIATHNVGTAVCVLNDGAMFSWIYDAADLNIEHYFKFQSFNTAGQNPQDISLLSAYTYTLQGNLPGGGTAVPPGQVLQADIGAPIVIYRTGQDGVQEAGITIQITHTPTDATRLAAYMYPGTAVPTDPNAWINADAACWCSNGDPAELVWWMPRPGAGVANVSGTAVTRVPGTGNSGLQYSGLTGNLHIAGTPYPIASVTDASHLTLASSAGTLTNAAVTSNLVWQIGIVAESANYFTKPDAATPHVTLTLTAIHDVPQPASFLVEGPIVGDPSNGLLGDSGGLPAGKFRYTATPATPLDPEVWYYGFDRIQCYDPTVQHGSGDMATPGYLIPITGATWKRIEGLPVPDRWSGNAIVETQTDWWPLPPGDEYWIWRCCAVNQIQVPNLTSPPQMNLKVPANPGVVAANAQPSQITSGAITVAYDYTRNAGKDVVGITTNCAVAWSGGAGYTTGQECIYSTPPTLWQSTDSGTNTNNAPPSTPTGTSAHWAKSDKLLIMAWVADYYSAAVAYSTGARLVYGTNTYTALRATQGEQPDTHLTGGSPAWSQDATFAWSLYQSRGNSSTPNPVVFWMDRPTIETNYSLLLLASNNGAVAPGMVTGGTYLMTLEPLGAAANMIPGLDPAVTTWISGSSYTAGQKAVWPVTAAGRISTLLGLYRSIYSGSQSGHQPDTSPTYWALDSWITTFVFSGQGVFTFQVNFTVPYSNANGYYVRLIRRPCSDSTYSPLTNTWEIVDTYSVLGMSQQTVEWTLAGSFGQQEEFWQMALEVCNQNETFTSVAVPFTNVHVPAYVPLNGAQPAHHITPSGGVASPNPADSDLIEIDLNAATVRLNNMPDASLSGRYSIVLSLNQEATPLCTAIIWGSSGVDSTYRNWPKDDQIPGGPYQRMIVYLRFMSDNLWHVTGWFAAVDNVGVSV